MRGIETFYSTLTTSQLRPVLFRLQDRRLPFAGQIFEDVGVEQRLSELAPLVLIDLAERGVAPNVLGTAAQLGARHWDQRNRAPRRIINRLA
jgi:hypothetical protein